MSLTYIDNRTFEVIEKFKLFINSNEFKEYFKKKWGLFTTKISYNYCIMNKKDKYIFDKPFNNYLLYISNHEMIYSCTFKKIPLKAKYQCIIHIKINII